MIWNLIRPSILNSVLISPDYTAEDIKSKEESTISHKSDTISFLLGSSSSKGSLNSSISSLYPTKSLSNFQLSTNSYVNIKGAELEI